MSEETEEVDRDDFTDASLTFPHSFKLSSSRNVDGSIQHLGETERALVTCSHN